MVNDYVRVVNEKNFTADLLKPPNSQFWKDVDCIQTCAKAKRGCGKYLGVHFFAPLNEEKPIAEIDFEGALSEFPSDRELLLK